MKRPALLRAAFLPAFLCFALSSLLFGEWLYFEAKGALAEHLIRAAFHRHLEEGGVHPPWSWADHHPIARIEHLESGTSRIVISGATGASMAFGVGHIHGTALPNGQGRSVVAGHRDGALRFLGSVERGDRFLVTSRGVQQVYEVRQIAVVDERELSLLEPGAGRSLALVTCYPLDALAPGSLRLVVVAEPAPRDGAMNLAKPA